MYSNEKRKILISQPVPSVKLPYLYATLKAYANQFSVIRENYEWLEPIIKFDSHDNIAHQIKGQTISVLGLSCYAWNWGYQIELAKYIKSRSPKTLVILGGPQPDHSDPDIFLKHPYFDAIVRHEGEVVFKEILERLSLGLNWREVSSLLVPGTDGRAVDTGPPVQLKSFDFMPIEECEEYFTRLIEEEGVREMYWETNRGCPYSCTFCAWGIGEAGKSLRKVPMERIAKEIEWMAKHDITKITFCDGNWGILPRDLEISKMLAKVRKEQGALGTLIFDYSKDNIERNVEISKILFDADLIRYAAVSWQHTDQLVLNAIKRRENKNKDSILAMRDSGIPIRPRLILGLPGDTYDKVRDCTYSFMDNGIHESFRMTPMIILPNTDCADPEYQKEWEFESVETYCPSFMTVYENELWWTRQRAKTGILVGCKTYSKEDWVQMMSFDSILNLLHSTGGLTRVVALFFSFHLGISFREFYEKLIFHFCEDNRTLLYSAKRRLDEKRRRFSDQDGQDDFYKYEGYEDVTFFMLGPEYVYCVLMEDLGRFYSELQEFLLTHFTLSEENREKVLDLVQFQKKMIFDDKYRPGKRIEHESFWDWPGFLQSVLDRKQELGSETVRKFSEKRTIVFLETHDADKIFSKVDSIVGDQSLSFRHWMWRSLPDIPAKAMRGAIYCGGFCYRDEPDRHIKTTIWPVKFKPLKKTQRQASSFQES